MQARSRIKQDDRYAADQLLPLVYEELLSLAARKIARETRGQAMQATALVHEAYIRLVDAGNTREWKSRAHFYCAAAEAMRRILIERSRKQKSAKAGGQHRRVSISQVDPQTESPEIEQLALREAIDNLAAKSPRKAELVKLRFFVGLTNQQAAKALGISARTAYNEWAYAKAYLRVELRDAARSRD